MKNRFLLFVFFLTLTSPLITLTVKYKDPSELLSKHRFSVMAKYIYAKNVFLDTHSQWAADVYYSHLFAINKCSGDNQRLNIEGKPEPVKSKNNIQEYQQSFHELINSMTRDGFDNSRSIIFEGDHTFLDGEHRLACSLYLNLKVPCLKIDTPDWMHSYSSEYFKNQKVDEKYLDAMALEYAKYKKNSYIVSLFSKARNHDDLVRKLLNQYGSIVHEREIILTKEGPINLMKLFYTGENWMGTWENGFPGARHKASACFNLQNNQFPIRVFLWECNGTLDDVRACKKEIRSLFHMNNDSVHINDTHKETILYAQAYFNENSLHFLNHAKPKKFSRFLTFIDQYKNWIEENNIDADCLCIDGSAILSAYGIRDCSDLDILHHGYDNELKQVPNKLIGSHNDEMQYHITSKDEIIFNPKNHFYCFGVKFASLEIIKKMKQNRNEAKDRTDVLEIKRYE